MKYLLTASCLLGLLVANVSAQETNPAEKPQSVAERASYAIGLNLGSNFREDGLEIVPAMLLRGIRDGLADAQPALTDAELSEALQAMQKQIRQAQAMKQLEANPELKALAEKNRTEGEAFLAANGKKEGVITTDSGLQYEIITSGSGVSPTATDEVTTHYHGTLIDGTVFDSSVDRGDPVSFGVGQVIPGWTEALQLMKVGDKWRLFIPSDLAYGLTPRPGGPIGPNQVLIFEVELLGVNE